ncbi:lactosylceramide 4-alpha-galactosyltransferase-like [Eriocheir sinensis]|uniref:lactosylceramide 4-alpha-galactosyltransferase-like n=1 Tax=Eriocheir sinensis TaxID=95602 RepID=UPI0021C6E239|nr:lactosylceramide 4-alpha-galactosyltransferase-like [Eriocheir sinensis]
MIFGPRPTLGWLGYLLLKGSWWRLAVLLSFLSVITVFLVHRGQNSVTLQHSVPSPFSPPVMFLPPPSHSYMTPLDVCSVEAAVEADEDGGASRDVLSGGEDWKLGRGGYPVRRQVYVFLWGSSMGPGDVWGRWVTRLPKVTVNLLDVPRTVSRTPIKGLAKLIGWTTYPEWMTWMAARVALLWAAGGVVLPLGMVPTRPLWLETRPRVLLAAKEEDGVNSVVLGASRHHPVLAAAARLLEAGAEGKTPGYLTNADELLTEAVKAACGVKTIDNLPSANCTTTTVLAPGEVLDMASTEDVREAEGASLLSATGDPDHLLHLPNAQYLFLSYQLARYCPKTALQLDAMYRNSL